MIQITFTNLPLSLINELAYYRENHDLTITASEFIKKQGMRSCNYSESGKYWEIDEVDYTWFIMRWS